jgi:hypothetical protein
MRRIPTVPDSAEFDLNAIAMDRLVYSSEHAANRLTLPHQQDPYKLKTSRSEGKRIGQQPDSKSGAPKGVGGSNPLPSASVPTVVARIDLAATCNIAVD